jgi:Zn-dependent protease with chaperone function
MTAASLLQSFDFQSLARRSLDLQSLAQISATRILNCAAEGIGIALLAWVLLRALGRQNSGTRFAVWFSALIGIAALPMLGHFGSSGAEPATRSEITMPASWALYIFVGWALIAAVGLARIGVGFWRLRQLRKSCVPIDPAVLDPLLRRTLEEFDSLRHVAVCVSDRLQVPTAIGFIRPLVVIPSWAMRELSPAELNTIVLHELAHLRRWDDWTNLAQKVLGALLFFHPAVWWIEKKLALEREMACDDLVLAKTASPRAYAECLVSLAEILAEKSLLRRGFALAQAAVGRVRHISLRVAQILDEKRPGATRVWRPAPVLLTGLSLACLMVFSDAPRLVSFENGSADSVSASAVAAVSNNREVDPTPRLGAQVVPANFVLKAKAKPSGSVPATTTAKTNTKPGKFDVIPVKARQRRVNPPMLVRTSMPEQDAIAPQTLILIMQTGRYDASGAVVWDLCVWQVTVIGPAHGRMEPGIVVKSI